MVEHRDEQVDAAAGEGVLIERNAHRKTPHQGAMTVVAQPEACLTLFQRNDAGDLPL